MIWPSIQKRCPTCTLQLKRLSRRGFLSLLKFDADYFARWVSSISLEKSNCHSTWLCVHREDALEVSPGYDRKSSQSMTRAFLQTSTLLVHEFMHNPFPSNPAGTGITYSLIIDTTVRQYIHSLWSYRHDCLLYTLFAMLRKPGSVHFAGAQGRRFYVKLKYGNQSHTTSPIDHIGHSDGHTWFVLVHPCLFNAAGSHTGPSGKVG